MVDQNIHQTTLPPQTELYINDTKTLFKTDTETGLNVIPIKVYKNTKPAPEITKTQIK